YAKHYFNQRKLRGCFSEDIQRFGARFGKLRPLLDKFDTAAILCSYFCQSSCSYSQYKPFLFIGEDCKYEIGPRA
ncbi:hypothetical protein L7F22_042732, partial [Adiantum nelumboides]|nr:hypothetical protein [Adiantum nelumboides]